MKFGFTNGRNTIVALAATSEHFLVIDNGDNVESLRGMTGLARVTGADVNRADPSFGLPRTALGVAEKYGNDSVADYLRSKGAR